MNNNQDYQAKLEFEIEELTNNQVESLKITLNKLNGVGEIKFDEKNNKLYVDTILPTSIIHNEIEINLNKLAVLKGMGSAINDSMITKTDSAVAEIMSDENNKSHCIRGVIRFVQLDNEKCAIDGTVDGLSPGEHAIHVHEFGDLSDGFNRVGNHFNPFNKKHGLNSDQERHAGDLGNITSNQDKRATFRMIDNQIKVWDIIGRSICISEKPNTKQNGENTGEILACGIIARSANVFRNIKKICACSGKTLWDERWDVKYVNSKI